MNMSDVNEIANNDSVVAQSHDKIELKDEMIGILLEKMNSTAYEMRNEIWLKSTLIVHYMLNPLYFNNPFYVNHNYSGLFSSLL